MERLKIGLSKVFGIEEAQSLNIRRVENIEELFDQTALSSKRTPFMEGVCDRFIKALTVSLKKLSSELVVIKQIGISTQRLVEVIEALTPGFSIGSCTYEQEDSRPLVILNHDINMLMVDIFLGGKKMQPTDYPQDRAYTVLEKQIMDRFIRLILKDFGLSFDASISVDFLLDHAETQLKLVTMDKPVTTVFFTQFKVEIEERSGTFSLVLPLSVLGPILERFVPSIHEETDPHWRPHLEAVLLESNFNLEVYVEQKGHFLSDVLEWDAGTQLKLDYTPESRVWVACNGKILYAATLGQKGSHLAIDIDEVLI